MAYRSYRPLLVIQRLWPALYQCSPQQLNHLHSDSQYQCTPQATTQHLSTQAATQQVHHCKECGGASICGHGRVRSQCKECGGASICQHARRRNKCKECRPPAATYNNEAAVTDAPELATYDEGAADGPDVEVDESGAAPASATLGWLVCRSVPRFVCWSVCRSVSRLMVGL